MFRNQMPRYEVLSAEAMATLDRGWRKLMTEIGVEFMDDRALDLFRQAGQRVDGNAVFLDPDFVLEQAAALEGGEHPRRRRLGQAGGLLQVGEGQRLVGVHHGRDQLGSAVDRLGAAAAGRLAHASSCSPLGGSTMVP